MSNLSDKEIDRLSREAADSFEPDASGLSWSRLEQRLTEQMPERPPDFFRFSRFNKPLVWGPAVLLLTGLSVFLIQNKTYRNKSTLTNQTQHQPAASSEKPNAASYTDSIARNAETNGATGGSSADATQPAVTPGTDQPVSGQISAEKINSNKNSENAASLPNARRDQRPSAAVNGGETSVSAINGNNNNKRNKTTGFHETEALLGASAAGHAAASPTDAGRQNFPNSSVQERQTLQSAEITGSAKFFALPDRAGSLHPAGTIAGDDSVMNRKAASFVRKPPVMQINRSFNFGLAFGPDYTDAGGISNNQFGNNIGLSLGYYVTKKISINSGFSYSNKFYWTPGHGFNPPSNRSQNPSGPATLTAAAAYAAPPHVEYVNGSSSLYEIPLTVRYDFFNKNKTKLFVNGGMSSYIITRQTYIYFSHNGYSPVAWKVTNNRQLNYWFDVVDFSFGMETEVGKGFSFQLEPFMRIPLKGMGMENEKMNTYGLMISFRFAPVLSRSRK